MSKLKEYGRPLFHEEKRWGFGLWSVIAFLYLSLVIALLVSINTGATIAIMLPVALAIYAIWKRSALSITVTKGWLIVGGAGIERAFIARAESLSPDEMRKQAGPEFNPDAYLQLRAWLRKGVKITLRDPRDPTPYWLIACNNPQELVRVLNTPEGR
jgi:hypothetical protein